MATELRRRLGVLVPADVAALLSVEERTLDNWRSARTGPPYVKAGKTVVYREDALMAWLAAHEQATQP